MLRVEGGCFMTDISQGERETYENIEVEMRYLKELGTWILQTADDTVESAIYKTHRKASEDYEAARGKIVKLEKDLDGLQREFDKKEFAVMQLEKRQSDLEHELQQCKPWDFAKRGKLQSELEIVKSTPRENISQLRDVIQSTQKEVQGLYKKMHNSELQRDILKKHIDETEHKQHKSHGHTQPFRPKRHK